VASHLVAAIALLLATDITIHGQAAGPAAALLDRAVRYVQEYERQFSAVVCEEQQVQRTVRSDGRERKRRELLSDLLLVKAGDRTVSFRDVISVDGKPVRDRQERLRKLFLEAPPAAMRQARAIADESARYNIGFQRAVDALMVPLEILQPRSVSGFRFASADRGLMFEEFSSPSLIRYRDGQGLHDMLLRGRLAIDADSGRLLGANLTARNSMFETTLDVRYVEDSKVGLLVPAEMQERYLRTAQPKEDRLEVSSTYTNFRRFEVLVNERIELPK